jgi:hypothetical protein
MRNASLRAWHAAVLFAVLSFCASSAFAQDPQASPAPSPAPATDPTTATDDANPVPPPDAASPDRLDLDTDTDSADLPAFFKGSIDTEDYLRMRNAHIRRLRGLMDKEYSPSRRNGAISDARAREQQLRQAAQGAGIPDPNFVGPTTPQASSSLLPASLLQAWTPLGPSPIPNGQTTAVSQAVSGRVTNIVIHPTNENIVYVGTAQGGVYRTLDGGTTWTALTDDALSLANGALALDPLDPTTLFVGTGEGNLSADSFSGVGLYIIKHADSTPQLLGPFNLDTTGTDVFTGRAITRILVDPLDDNVVFVSTTSGIGGIGADSIPSVLLANLPSRGLYRSTNAMSAGPRFSKITVQPANGGNRGITDIAFGATPNTLIAGVNGFSTGGNDGGIWLSTNALDPTPTFTNQVVVGTATATIQIRFASNTVNGVTTMLAATGESPVPNGSNCGAPGWVRRSTNGGVTWSLGLIQTSGFCNSQCFYDMSPAMDPTNSNIIYLGGAANADTNPARATCRSNVLTRTLDCTNFSRIDTGLHADTHAVAVAPSNPSVVYFGSDGGVWRSSNQGTTWQSINTAGFQATQFQSVAVHPSDRNFSIGGTQDNGTNFFRPDGTWTRADFGDGGFALIDQSATDTTNVTMYHTYFNQTNNLIGFGRVTTTANAQDNGWGFLGCNGTVANNGFRCADTVLFYAPMTLGPGTPNTLYFGTDRLYRSVNRGTTMTLVSQGPFQAGVAVSSIGISPQNDNVRIVGLRNGGIFATTTGANPLVTVRSAAMPAKYVSRAVIDPNNANTAYVAFSGFGIPGQQIWKTTNLNANPPTWSIAAAGLPDVPVNGFAVDPVNSNNLYAGSDIGVFVSTNGGQSWNPFGTGLPRVAVFDMAVQAPNRLLRIATHGRGLWEIPAAKTIATVTLSVPGSATYGDNVTFTATVGSNGAQATPTGTVTFSDGGLTLGTGTLDASQTATFSTTLLSAGTHSITATFNGDNIFDVSPSAPSSITINQAPLSVTAANASRLYGSPNPVFTGSIVGIKNGDNITATYATTATQSSPVGTYPIVPTLVDPDNKLGNYTVTSTNGVLTINPAPLTITAQDATKVLNSPNPSFTASYSGFVLGEGPAVLSGTLTCTTTALLNSPVGSYPITCSGQTSTNYAITYVAGTLHIDFATNAICVGEPGHQILHPINADGTTVFNGNGPIDVKFRVCDANGVSQSTPGTVTNFSITNVIRGILDQSVDLPVDPKPGTNGFVFAEDRLWLFRIDGKSLATGFTYVFRIDLNDGSSITFQFGKR